MILITTDNLPEDFRSIGTSTARGLKWHQNKR